MLLCWMEILKFLFIPIEYSYRYRNIPIMYGNIQAMDESALQLLPNQNSDSSIFSLDTGLCI